MKTWSFAPALPVPQVQLRLCPCELARLCGRAQGQRLARHLHSQLVRAQSPLDRGLDTVTEGKVHSLSACPLLLTPTRTPGPAPLDCFAHCKRRWSQERDPAFRPASASCGCAQPGVPFSLHSCLGNAAFAPTQCLRGALCMMAAQLLSGLVCGGGQVEQAQLAHLCTVMSGMHHRRAGYPFGTLTDFASDGAGFPVFCLSPLAIHTRNIIEDPRCSLVVQLPGWTGLANARVTIFGDVFQLPPELQESAKEVFLQKQARSPCTSNRSPA